MRSRLSLLVSVPLLLGCEGEPTGFDRLDCTVTREAIFDVGVARDGIPALTTPEVVPGGEGSFLDDDDRVLGLVVNGEARAYPFTVLWWHEVVNDTLGGQPVLVTYCPLTGSGIAFNPMVDGELRSFGVSGLLYRTNLTMFDRRTESLWNQMALAGICGLDRGKALALLPVVETTWRHWQQLHPQTSIITQNTDFDRPYGVYPYGSYDEPFDPFIAFVTRADRAKIRDDRPPKELVLGVFEGPRVTTYPFGVLSSLGAAAAVNDTVGDVAVLITYVAEDQTARAFDRTVDGETLTFRVAGTAPLTLEDAETGTRWDATGDAVSGRLVGRRLTPLADAYVAFWFAWNIYFDEVELYLPEGR